MQVSRKLLTLLIIFNIFMSNSPALATDLDPVMLDAATRLEPAFASQSEAEKLKNEDKKKNNKNSSKKSTGSKYTNAEFVEGLDPDLRLKVRTKHLRVNPHRGVPRATFKIPSSVLYKSVGSRNNFKVGLYEVTPFSTKWIRNTLIPIKKKSRNTKFRLALSRNFTDFTKTYEIHVYDTSGILYNKYQVDFRTDKPVDDEESFEVEDTQLLSEDELDYIYNKLTPIIGPASSPASLEKKSNNGLEYILSYPVASSSGGGGSGTPGPQGPAGPQGAAGAVGPAGPQGPAGAGATPADTVNNIAAPGANLTFNEAGDDFDFRIEGDNDPNLIVADASTDRVGIGVAAPTAALHLKAGTAAAGTAPLKFETGVNLTTPENGAVEYDGSNLFLTVAGARKTLAFTDSATTGDGSGITNLNASNLASGTLADARLSANVPLLNGNNAFTGNNSLGDALTDTITVGGTVQGGTPFVFEGATDDAFETNFLIADPTTDNNITFQNGSGTVAFLTDVVGGGGGGEFADGGTFLYPVDAAGVQNVVLGDTVEANADIRLNANGSAIFNEQGADSDFRIEGDNDVNLFVADASTDNIGIGILSPTASLHLKAGTATASTAPIKLSSGTNLTTPEDGALEYDGSLLSFTVGANRKTLLFNDGNGSALTNLDADNVASGTLAAARGGTGVSNTGTITLGANNLVVTGGATTLTATGATNVTLPTTGTLASLAGTETLTNKTINATNNTITNINASNLSSGTVADARLSANVALLNANNSFTGSTTLGDAGTDTITINSTIQSATPFVFEGATANAFETSFAVTDPTADRTITFKDESGTVALLSDVGGGAFADGGDTATADRTLGNNDNFDLGLETNGATRLLIQNDGNIGLGVDPPTAVLHLKAGTATTSTAPLKFETGVNLTTPENGAVEYDGSNLFLTVAGARKTLAFTDSASTGNGSGITDINASNISSGTIADARLSANVALLNANNTFTGNSSFGDAATDTITVTGTVQGASPLVFEGATDDAFESTLAFVDPTADRTITFQDGTGTVAFLSDIGGGAGQLTDAGSFLYPIETGDNFIIGANTEGTATINLNADGTAEFDGDITANANLVLEGVTADANETTLVVTDPTADRTITFQDGTGTVAFLSDIGGGAGQWNDTGSIVHPLEPTVDEIVIGGTTEAGADIFLGVDGTTVFNEQGNAVDFRIESDSDVNAFVVDASANNVGIGTATPGTKLHVSGGNITANQFISATNGNSYQAPIGLASTPAFTFTSDLDTGIYRDQVDQLGIATSGSEKMLFFDDPGGARMRRSGTTDTGAVLQLISENNGSVQPRGLRLDREDSDALSTLTNGIAFHFEDSIGVLANPIANIDVRQTASTSGSQSSEMDFDILTVGAQRNPLTLASNAARPGTDSFYDLGTTAIRWKELFTDDITVTTAITAGGTVTANAFVGDGSGLTNLPGGGGGGEFTDVGAYVHPTETSDKMMIGASTAPDTELHIFSTVNSGVDRILTLETVDTSTPGSNAIGTGMIFKADDNTNASTIYAAIDGLAADVTDGSEDGRIEMFTTTAGTLTEVVSFDGTDGMVLTAPRMRNVSGAGLEIEAFANSGVRRLTIETRDTSTPGNNAIGSGVAFEMDNNAEEEIVYAAIDGVASNVADGTEAGKVEISAMTGGAFAEVAQFDGTDGMTLTAPRMRSANGAGLEIENFVGSGTARLTIETRDTSTPGNNAIGSGVAFEMDNNAEEEIIYAAIDGVASNVADGTEAGKVEISAMTGGSFAEVAQFDGTSGMTLTTPRMRNAAGTGLEIENFVTSGTQRLTIETLDTGTPVNNGIGSGIAFEMDNNVDAEVVYGTLDLVASDVVNGTEDGELTIGLMENGSLAEELSLSAANGLNITSTILTGGTGVNGSGIEIRRDDGNASLIRALSLQRNDNSAAGAAGIGTGMAFKLEDAGSVTEISGAVDVVTTNAVTGTTDSEMNLSTLVNNTLTEIVTIDSSGLNLKAGVFTGDGSGLTNLPGGGGSSEWTDAGTYLHPTDSSGVEDVIIGSNATPNTPLHVNYTNNGANPLTRTFTLERLDNASSVSTGIGTGMVFRLEDTSRNVEDFAAIDAISIDSNAVSTDGELSFSTLTNNISTEVMTIDGTNGVGLTSANARLYNASGGVVEIGAVNAGGTVPLLRLEHVDSGSIGVNGAAMDFALQDSTLGLETYARIDTTAIATADGSETGEINWSTIQAGSTLDERMTLDGANGLGFTSANARIYNKTGGATEIASYTFGGLATTLRLEQVDSNSAGATGLGSKIDFAIENNASDNEVYGAFDTTSLDSADGSEDGEMNWSLMSAGTLAERMTLDPSNGLGLTSANARIYNKTGGTTEIASYVAGGLATTLRLENLDSNSAGAVGLGSKIDFALENNASEDIVYGSIDTTSLDSADGSEDGEVNISATVAGIPTEIVTIDGNGLNLRNGVFTGDGSGLTNLPGGGGGSEWTDTGTDLHPSDNSGAENILIGGTSAAGADIVLNADGSAVFNEIGAAVDFRIESDTQTDLFFVDGSTNRIGIGTTTPTHSFEVNSDTIAFDASWATNLLGNGIAVLDSDASLDLVSDDVGTLGSVINFHQLDVSEATDFEDMWTLVREVKTGVANSGSMVFKYGTDSDYTNNSDVFEIQTDGDVYMKGLIDIPFATAGTTDHYVGYDEETNIAFVSTGHATMQAIGDVQINIDSNANTTGTATFTVAANGEGYDEGGETNLFVINENGNASLTGTMTANAFSGDGSALTGISAGEWTDTGTILHPTESTVDEIAIGGTTEAGADIFLGVDGTAVFNEQGNAVDFRIEGDTDVNALVVDASADNVGIGTATPARKLHVADAMRLEPIASPPSTPASGDLYFDSSEALCIYVDGAWSRIAGSGSCS